MQWTADSRPEMGEDDRRAMTPCLEDENASLKARLAELEWALNDSSAALQKAKAGSVEAGVRREQVVEMCEEGNARLQLRLSEL